MPAQPRSIAIVDDHELFVDALQDLLHLLGYKVALRAHSAEEFMERMLVATAPELALIDLHLPRENGFAVLRWLNAHRPMVRGIVISFAEEPDLVQAALDAGARSFVSKTAGKSELKRVLEEVRTRGWSEPGGLRMESGLAMMRARARALGVPDREFEFLLHITRPADLTYDQVATRMSVSRWAVDGYARWFRKHFGLRSRPAIALWAVAHGLVPGHDTDTQLALSAWRVNRELHPPPPSSIRCDRVAPRVAA